MIKNELALQDARHLSEILTKQPVPQRVKIMSATRAGEALSYLLAVIKEQDKDIHNLTTALKDTIKLKKKVQDLSIELCEEQFGAGGLDIL